jgi:hypothetical protein
VNRIESFGGQLEPASMQPVYPVMRKTESTKPQTENTVIDNGAPKQEFFEFNNGHENFSKG